MSELYDPNHLLDHVVRHLNLKNDAALSRALEVAPPVISKIRHARLPVGGAILLRMHETTGLSLEALRSMMGDRRRKFRISSAQGRPKA
jgi:F0F1-type ATP synthase beta subunit